MNDSQPGAGEGIAGISAQAYNAATNQLLAGLAFLVIAFYLIRRHRPMWFLLPPLAVMVVMPAWAMLYNMYVVWVPAGKMGLFFFGLVLVCLQVWMIAEGLSALKHLRAPLDALAAERADAEGGRVC